MRTRAHGRRELSWGLFGGTTWGAASSPCCCEARVVLPGLLLWSTLLPSSLEQLLVQTVLGYPSVWRLLEEFPLLRALRRAIRTWKSGHCHRPCIFSPSVFGCCLWSTLYSGRVLGSTVDTCFTSGVWRISHIFYVWCTQIVAFLSIPQTGEVCTVDASSCSDSSRGSHFESGHYFYEFSM